MDIGTMGLIAGGSLILGIVIGFLFCKLVGGSSSGNVKNELESLQARFSSYQDEVVNHFNETAAMAQQLSQNYTDMQKHLEQAAQSLVMNTEERAKLLGNLVKPEVTDDTEESATETKVIPTLYDEIPKDYAPKTPGENGTLDEEFTVKHK